MSDPGAQIGPHVREEDGWFVAYANVEERIARFGSREQAERVCERWRTSGPGGRIAMAPRFAAHVQKNSGGLNGKPRKDDVVLATSAAMASRIDGGAAMGVKKDE